MNEPTLCAQLWRLPALLVDDFSELTPELLRTAYVEALYRVDEFEFERLTQSYWHALIGKVSDSMSTQPLLDMCVTLTLNHNGCCPQSLFLSLSLLGFHPMRTTRPSADPRCPSAAAPCTTNAAQAPSERPKPIARFSPPSPSRSRLSPVKSHEVVEWPGPWPRREISFSLPIKFNIFDAFLVFYSYSK